MSTNKIKLICELERYVMDKIYSDNKATCHFDYEKDANSGKISLSIITSSSFHKEVFVLYTTEYREDKIECLEEVQKYLQESKTDKYGYVTYEIKWRRCSNEIYKSFFCGLNLKEIVDKFYKDKDPNEYKICSIIEMPIS